MSSLVLPCLFATPALMTPVSFALTVAPAPKFPSDCSVLQDLQSFIELAKPVTKPRFIPAVLDYSTLCLQMIRCRQNFVLRCRLLYWAKPA
ncbi:hypothetical protein [Microcoleus sp. FACHB-68]|uniref:hypothetical protein n=1 Tax=Microcoleus sp. FACHB-68 TaxID=2692826 RepID=UPI001687A1FC|nr:hypothetical protein [Microcoleus sp. FACHB-68]MBD1937608.1 hypothetical protein [Microcoleus sp. FACHB-68]